MRAEIAGDLEPREPLSDLHAGRLRADDAVLAIEVADHPAAAGLQGAHARLAPHGDQGAGLIDGDAPASRPQRSRPQRGQAVWFIGRIERRDIAGHLRPP